MKELNLTLKICSKCKLELSIDSFNKHKRMPDGIRSECRSCTSEANRKWREANVEKRKIDNKKWRDANSDKDKQRKLDYYYSNKLKMQKQSNDWHANNSGYSSDYMKQWREDNPGRSSEYVHVRRTRMQNNGLYKVLKRDLKRLYSASCAYCGATEDITLDHVVPLKRGGSHGIGNLVAACRTCNSSKGAKLLVEWRKSNT